MISNVLVPLDGSLLSEQALPTAMSLVRKRHGHLELLLVQGKRGHGWIEGRPWAVVTPKEREAYVTDTALEWANTLGEPIGHVAVSGDAAVEICKRAQELHADLIVMSTHGHTGLTRMFTGSVADSVIRASRTPVLLLRPPPPGRPIRRAPLRFERMLVPIDESAASRQVFGIASDLAERGYTEMLLLRVVPDRRLVASADAELAAAAQDLEARSGCDVFPHVIVHGNAGRGIVHFARRFNASLVAMTTHGRGASRLVLGSVTDAVLRNGMTPMLVVRPVSTSDV
jgi:nucleotide-binding universal stress UspA family protein